MPSENSSLSEEVILFKGVLVVNATATLQIGWSNGEILRTSVGPVITTE